MAYIGKAPVNGFHSKQTLSTDGSTTTFTLDFTVADETSLIVSVGGVLQEPKVAYNLSGGGTSIVFTAAPAATDTAYIQYLGQAIVQNLLDLSGGELILDADNDTTITADTDDQIDIKIAGADDFQFTANKFSILTGSNQSFADNTKGLFGTGDDLEVYHDGTNSYIANKTGALKIATETSGIALTIGHTTSETTVADNLTVTGNLTVGGTTSFGDFDITNVGSIALDTITNDGTDITLDSSADIVIDAAGGNVEFKDAGTLQLTIDMDGTAGAQVIQLGVDSDDLIFKQYDGTTVLTLDDDTTVKVATDLTIGDDASLISDAAVLNFGADSEIKLTHVADTGLLLTDSGGSPTLQLHDANEAVSSDGSKLILTSNGVAFSLPTADGSNGQALISNGSGVLSFTTLTANTPSSADGQALGSASLEWSDLFLADASTIQFGNDQDVLLTHVADTGLLLSGTNVIQFNDASQNIGAPSATVLDINATDEIELNATLVDINANVEISGTATTTGVHTFTAVPVFPDNTVESADIQADAITGAKIADDAINSEHYTDGSIDTAHIADAQITTAKLSSAVLTGATDIGADLADADLMLVDDGAGGTLRKSAMSRIKTYIGGTGKIAQVVQTVKTDVFTTTSSTLVDVTGLSRAITPSASDSRILVMVEITGAATDNGVVQLQRGTTIIGAGAAEGNRTRSFGGSMHPASAPALNHYSISFIDSPNTTSAVTYKIVAGAVGGGTTILGKKTHQITMTHNIQGCLK